MIDWLFYTSTGLLVFALILKWIIAAADYEREWDQYEKKTHERLYIFPPDHDLGD